MNYLSLSNEQTWWLNLSENLPGYKGLVLKVLSQVGVNTGDVIRITKNGEAYEGILVPRSEYSDDQHIVIKLKSGYNIGVRITPSTRVEKLGSGAKLEFSPPSIPVATIGLPKVVILGTGGTIASRVDYRTGAVRPALSASDLYSIVPELSNIAEIETKLLFNIWSENMTCNHWSELAKEVAKQIEKGADGVVITHGTDTIAYTAAALSFALQNLPVPVILVGSQRSSDRPSSDAASNLIAAVTGAGKAPFAEVVLAMHDTISDEPIAFHQGTRVRKFHTSRRDAFKSIDRKPIALFEQDKITMQTTEFNKRDISHRIILKPAFNEKVALVKHYPSFSPKIIEWLANNGYFGIILEGTGLGHISKYCYDSISKATEKKVFIGMTSQCVYGRVNMNVYETGRDLLALGVVPLDDMLPETALVKAMWAFGQTLDFEQVKRIMLTNIAGEFQGREICNSKDPVA